MASIKLTNESVEARVEVLQGQENYLAWKRDLKFIAEANNVWNILTGEETIQDKPTRPTISGVPNQAKPAKKSNGKDADPIGSGMEAQTSDQLSFIIQFYKLDLDEYEKQQKRLRYARGLLSTTINTALRGCIKDEENPQLAMEKLKGLCKMNDARALDMTLGKIEQLRFKGSVSDLINTLKTLQQDITDLEGTFSDEQLMSKVVRSLPNRFNRFLDTWNLLAGTAALPRDLVTLHGHLLGVEAQLASEKDGKENDAKTKGRERKDRQLCEGCNKWGTHNESECWIAHPELREFKFNKREGTSQQFKGQVNTVKDTGSKDHPKSQPRRNPKHPGRIVATAVFNRSKWEATCANVESSDKITHPDKHTSMKNETNVPDYNRPGDSLYPRRPRLIDGLNPQTMMLLKDDAVERSSMWIVDSGANVCIANDKAWFSEFQKITYTVGTANNGGLHIEGTGTVLLQLITDGNEPVELELHHVAYARDARCNILSLSWIAEKAGLTGHWGIKGMSIRTAEGFEIGHASLIDGLFHLQIDPPHHPSDVQPSQGEPILLQANSTRDAEAVGEDSMRTPDQQLPPGVQPPFVVSLLDYDDPVWKWHRRMGHLSIQSLRDLLKVSNGIDLTDKQLQAKLGTICPVCATTRAVNRIPRDPATRRATNPGEIMHADTWGPYPVGAWDGTIYVLAMTDDATRFTWSARYATKDKIPNVFRHLHRTIEKRNNITIRAYRLDNEFPSYGELRDWFQRHAISLENSVPHTHHMNGVAERGFRTDRERASAMLQEATNSISSTISKILGTRTEEAGRCVKFSVSLPSREDKRCPRGQPSQDKCERCRKNGYVCKRTDQTSRCDHCNKYGLICSFVPDDDRRKGQPPQDKCDQCRQVKAVCTRSDPHSRCDKCQSVSRVCSFVPEDNKVPRWSDTYLPPEKKCYACSKERRRCYPTDDPNTCRNCPMRGYKCSFGGNVPRGTQDPKVKCKQCRKGKRWCEGGSAETRCIPCQKRRFRCSMLASLNDPECVACQGSRRWGSARRCQAIPCLHCRTSGRTTCSFRVDPNTAVYHPIQQNLHPKSMWHEILDLGIQHECCAHCAELGLNIDAIIYSDYEFPCNMCIARQELFGTKRGTTCLQFNDDGGYRRFFFRGTLRGPPPRRLTSPPPMTEAGTTIGEDEEGWETLDDSFDEDLEIEDSEMPLDPALLEPRANLVIASCINQGNHILSPSRLHRQVHDFQQELQAIEIGQETNGSSSSTTSTFSSPVSLRETADKGKITVDEASMPTICMMSVSANSFGPEPHTRKTALASTECNQWEQAMQEEYDSLLENKTWEVVDRPTDRKVLTGRWVFKRKLGSNGDVARHKARFVVRGFSQIYGLDFDETYASVVKSASYRLLFALQARYGWKCHQMDIKTAFLNGDLEHEIFVEPPEGYPEPSDQVLKLCKSLYGLKQAPRQWYFKLRAFLEDNGWRVSNFDPSVFIKDDENLIMEVYVDDINIFGQDEDLIIAVKRQLASRFNMTDLGLCAYYLGMHVHQEANGDVHLHQESYIQQILNRYGLQDIHPRKTPMRTGLKLSKSEGLPRALDFQRRYQSKVGALNYAMVVTRPDIAEAVGVASRFCANPTEEHMKAVDDIYAYLKYTPNLGLHFKRDCADRELHAYVDADWAGCLDTRRSTTGYVVKLAGSPISWSSRRQRTVAMSTCEAEYVAGYKATQEIIWIQNMINDLRIEALEATSTPLLIDNNAALKLTRNPELHDRTKHIELKYHFLREMTLSGRIDTQRVATKDNLADLLTKPLPRDAHENLVNGLGMDKSSCIVLATCS